MEARAEAKYIRCSPQKARLVVDLIRGLPAGKALHLLRFTKKRVAHELEKVLRSAIHNAESKSEEEEPEPKAAADVERDEHGLLHLTDANFNDVINNKEGVLFVKFYAPW